MTTTNETIFMRIATKVGTLLLVGVRHGGLSGVYFEGAPHAASAVPRGAREDARAFDVVRAQLEEYLDGTRTTFTLPLAPRGTEFQRRVWSALARIPYGATTTYAAIARTIGAPRAVRAVGAANGRNPLAIVVPCHRVIGRDGTLTGYAGGLERKRALLALESASVRSRLEHVDHEEGVEVARGPRTAAVLVPGARIAEEQARALARVPEVRA